MKRNLLIITLLFLGSFVILLLGNIIIIGEKIASLSQVAWAEYAFYTLLLVVFMPSLYRSEEHRSELQSVRLISYAVFCLKKT